MSVASSFEKETLALHNHLPLCCWHIVLAGLVREVSNVLNCAIHMASVMRNGYLVYMKLKSRGVQSAANTEPTGLSLSFERQNSRWKQC